MLLSWLQVAGKGFVITFDMGGGEVWSYPAYRFESEWTMDPTLDGVWRVKTTVWMADMDVPTNFVGLKPYPGPAGKVFEYTLEGDPWQPTGGGWTGASQQGRFARPGRIWYPEPGPQSRSRARQPRPGPQDRRQHPRRLGRLRPLSVVQRLRL